MPILLKNYEQLVATGKIQNDEAQREILALLQKVLDGFKPKKRLPLLKKRAEKPQGIYIWGNVGRGKSMLMDLFFASAPMENIDELLFHQSELSMASRRSVDNYMSKARPAESDAMREKKKVYKRRIHFHAFMQEVHARIHEIRKRGLGDPVALLAKQIAGETALLCFDELQANDIADASILYRLFEGLFAHDVCIISTSNRPPEELYTGGVQAERFANFINLIKQKMQIAPLSSMEDYRYKQGTNSGKTYHYPLGASADKFVAEILASLGASETEIEILHIHGRELKVKTYNEKIAIFSFAELCENPLGAADYLAIAKNFSTIILTNIPALSPEKRNEAKRFVTLIDALYEHKTKLFITAQTLPEKIYDHGDGRFEFHRTVSRLTEMQSVSYCASYFTPPTE